MSDLISRQQAIDVIDKEQKEIDVSDVSAMYAYSKCKTIIKQLPSVLGTNLAEVGTDCISRQQAINKILGQPPEPHYPSWYAEQIKELPSAQPEIVRCKDCDWWTKQEDSLQGRCALLQMYPTGGWFCGNARRREVTE